MPISKITTNLVKPCCPSCLKGWITLSTGYITIQRMSVQNKLHYTMNTLVCFVNTYPRTGSVTFPVGIVFKYYPPFEQLGSSKIRVFSVRVFQFDVFRYIFTLDFSTCFLCHPSYKQMKIDNSAVGKRWRLVHVRIVLSSRKLKQCS